EITDKAKHKGYGLAHILDKHPEITSEILNDIIQFGKIKARKNEALQIQKDNFKLILKSNWKGQPSNKWIVTAYEDEKGLSISSKPLTEADSLASNSSNIIPQTQLTLINNRIKEFAKILDNTTNPQNIEVKDLQSLANWLSGWNVKPIKAEAIFKNPRKFFHYFNSQDFNHLLLDIDALKFGVDLKAPEEVKQALYLLRQSEKDFKYAEEHLKLKGKDKDLRIKEFHRAEKIFKESREKIENHYNIQPLKEFGTNYAEYYRDGVGAINKILAEQKDYKARKAKGELTQSELTQGEFKGQVAGAFYRKDLEELSGNGDITLVWGEITDKAKHKGYGLAHILDKHPDFNVNFIPKIIEQGDMEKTHNGFNILYGDYLIGINKGFRINGKMISEDNFIVTAFENLKKEGSSKSASAADFTKGASLPLNSDEIIPQTKLKDANEDSQSQTHSSHTLSLKEQLAQAKELTEKKEIIHKELTAQLQILDKQINEFKKTIQQKDWSDFEIQEAINHIQSSIIRKQTNAAGEEILLVADYSQPKKGRINITMIPSNLPQNEQAELFLSNQLTKELERNLYKAQDDIIRRKSKLEFLFKNRERESYSQDFQTFLQKQEQLLLKAEEQHNKAISLTYDLNTKEGEVKVKRLFASEESNQEQKELFNLLLPVAKKLGVKVRHAIRDPYEYLIDTKTIAGLYTFKDNIARVKHNGNIDKTDKPRVLLHELIHSVTSRAMYAHSLGLKDILTPRQITAIENIQDIYKQLLKQKKILTYLFTIQRVGIMDLRMRMKC
ncbi:MAG: hypothetical protein K2I71_01205, partial [Helicobacter sp.]|nr:hypothetical protein [Helicobacter sp.]